MRRILPYLLCAALGTARALAATCPSGLFVQAESVPSGGQGTAVAIAPIDSDASPDIVTVNQNSNSISVLISNGDGTFSAPIVTPIPFSSLFSVAVGDLNGDTKADLVIGTYYEVLVLLGHGDGTFEDPVEYPANIGAITGISLEKFDANASLDIAAVGGNGSIVVLLGNGDGTFAPGVPYPVSGAKSLTSGDFNGDGHLDLATAAGISVVVLLGVGDGTFGPPSAFVAGSNLSGIAAGDLNGDGHVDLIAGSDSFVSVLLGNGNGTFQAALQYDADVSVGRVAIADFDLDGIPDVIVAASFDPYGGVGGVAVLRGSGDGSLSEGERYASGSSVAGLAVGDLNGDGLPDVVTADPAAFSVSVFIDMADGALYAAPVSTISQGPSSSSFAQADFDEDGRQDFAWLQYTSVTTVLGTSHGRFRAGATLADPISQQVIGIGAGDFSGNHHADLVVDDFSAVWLFPGNGDGTFGNPQDVFDSFSLGPMIVDDFNGDGKLDIAVNQGCCGPTNVIVLPGNGNGSFNSPLQTALSTDARLILAADLNGDGRLDLVANTSASAILLPGNGDGTFSTPILLESGQTSFLAATGDFDGNGHLDLLLSNESPSVELFLADGSGALQPPVVIGVGGASGPLAVADFDSDGNLDFAVETGPMILVLRGLGNGHFQTPLIFSTDSTPMFIAGGDYDGNGRPDLASVSNQSITTFLNAQLGVSIPNSISVIVGSPVVLQASAGGGFGPITYQWRKNGVPLSDGGPISGVTTATLTIDPVAFTDAGSYDVVVTDSCGSANSNAATLSVEFDDVPFSNPFHDDIITIATAGITAGCNTGTSYCPSASVSRAEMAVFLLKAKFGADHVPPPPPPVPIFADVPAGAFAAAWIDELSTLGITGGCGNGNYCPDDPVTRGQMAVFLLKTLLGSGYVLPTATGIFADVPSDYFAIDWIEDLYARGITAGCGTNPLRYCPDQAVPREQMAAFLVRTFLSP